jgi:hypothetical protein
MRCNHLDDEVCLLDECFRDLWLVSRTTANGDDGVARQGCARTIEFVALR